MSSEQAGRLARSLFDDMGQDDAEPPAVNVGDLVEGFEVLEHVASGGTCDVYRAVDAEGRPVALKVLKAALPPEIEWRVFEREAAALGRLRHPAIARLFGSGRVRGSRAYLAIEFVDGERLTSHACGAGVRRVAEVFAAICEGVDYAHMAGVIHRDLKPSNILVDADGRPRIVDFGVSLPSRVHHRSPHALWSGGTRAYMSPEQIGMAPRDLDSRSDVFSLGVILHQLLLGRRPFDVEGLDAREALERMRIGAREIGKGGPRESGTGGFGAVIARALAFDRDLRFQSAGELGRACLVAAERRAGRPGDR